MWKGPAASEIIVTTEESDCGRHFEQGKSYLVWAYPAPDGPEYRVEGALAADFGICGATRLGPINEQDEDIRVLNYETRVTPILRTAGLLVGAAMAVLLVGFTALRGRQQRAH
jgi:hypothetical protein